MKLKPKDPNVIIYYIAYMTWAAWNSRTRTWLRLAAMTWTDAVDEYEHRTGRRWYK